MSNARAARGRYIPADLYPAGPGRAVLATAQGCPRRCHYCASSILAPRFTPRSLDEILADLNGQLSCGPVSDLAFYDDALLWDRPKRFYPLCDYLEKHHPELKLHSPNGLSVDDLDAECCRRLRRAGFKTLRLSLEGVDAYTNAAGGSKTSADNYKQAVENLVAAGYEPGDIETYLLAGLPGQKTDAVLRSIEFVKSLGGRPKLCEYSPIPGTRLFEAAAAEHPVLKTEPLWHNNTVYTPYLSGAMGPDELQYLKGCLKGRAEAAD
ncbi:radical SAM protein [Deltaproteobacteria bacterium OttesenSCG-928-K17]|nr:radical SAM protein [Deltaproteobacteria bacterium OttesenSCG-928-K17]